MVRALALILAAALAIGGPADARSRPARHKPVHSQTKAVTTAKPRADEPPARSPDPAPSLPLSRLLSANEAEARARLGSPDLARTEGSGALWTYRLPDCALFVFFKAAEGQPLRVSGAATGPRRRGQAPAAVDACIAQALAARAGP